MYTISGALIHQQKCQFLIKMLESFSYPYESCWQYLTISATRKEPNESNVQSDHATLSAAQPNILILISLKLIMD